MVQRTLRYSKVVAPTAVQPEVLLTDAEFQAQLNRSNAALMLNSGFTKPGMAIQHYNLEVRNHNDTLAKRDTRLMDQCSRYGMRGWIFMASNCNRLHTLQDIAVYCHPPGEVVEREVLQSCNRDEICFDTGTSAADARAYCVKTQSFRTIPDSSRRGQSLWASLVVPAVNTPFAANALLTDQYHQLPFTRPPAKSFELAALRREAGTITILERHHYPGSYSYRIQPLPDGTNLLNISVEAERAPAGRMYLITFS